MTINSGCGSELWELQILGVFFSCAEAEVGKTLNKCGRNRSWNIISSTSQSQFQQ